MGATTAYKPQFYVDALTPAQAEAAYPLIRSVAPDVSAEAWHDYVQRRCRMGGLLGLHAGDGTISGLLSYRLGERMRLGLVLALDDFVTFELSRAAPGRQALLAAAEQLALELGCTGIELRLGAKGFAGDDSIRARGWTELGLALDSVVFVKRLSG